MIVNVETPINTDTNLDHMAISRLLWFTIMTPEQAGIICS
jgi:hypothetical protein